MAGSANDFERELLKFSRKTVHDMVANTHKAICLDALKGVTMKTPVDTGRARGNWQVTTGKPASDELDRVDKTGETTMGIGNARIAHIKFGDTVYLTNNLPYITALEHGHSKVKSPRGMVAVTLAELQEKYG